MHGLRLFFGVAAMVSLLVTIARAEDRSILMASTIGPIDAGIVSALEEQFEKESGIRVRHVGAGTGEALKIAEQGAVELVMVHAKSLEEKFVVAGYGTERIPFMYNDFVIVGPADDPAGIRGMKSAGAALAKIAGAQKRFISRGDKSGTHVAELDLWTRSGVKPSGDWYVTYDKGREGNGPTLKYTDQQGAYTVIDRATWVTLKASLRLQVLVEGDEALLNYISLIPVNPKKFPKLDHASAMAFVAWLTDPDRGQLVVRDFGREKFGEPLFFPNSREWVKRNVK